MTQCYCGEAISTGRLKLGYQTCLECGEIDAKRRAAELMLCIVDTHKSNAVFIRPENARERLQDIARMRRG